MAAIWDLPGWETAIWNGYTTAHGSEGIQAKLSGLRSSMSASIGEKNELNRFSAGLAALCRAAPIVTFREVGEGLAALCKPRSESMFNGPGYLANVGSVLLPEKTTQEWLTEQARSIPGEPQNLYGKVDMVDALALSCGIVRRNGEAELRELTADERERCRYPMTPEEQARFEAEVLELTKKAKEQGRAIPVGIDPALLDAIEKAEADNASRYLDALSVQFDKRCCELIEQVMRLLCGGSG